MNLGTEDLDFGDLDRIITFVMSSDWRQRIPLLGPQTVSARKWEPSAIYTICTWFLSWVVIQRFQTDPLRIKRRDYYEILQQILDESRELTALFEVSSTSLDYRPTVTATTRAQIEEFVNERYRPEAFD